MDEKTKARLEKMIGSYQNSFKEAEEKPARERAMKEKFLKDSREFMDNAVIPAMESMKEYLETKGFSCLIVDEEVEGNRSPGQYDWRIIMYVYPGEVDLNKPEYLGTAPFIWFSAFKYDQSIVILDSPWIASKEDRDIPEDQGEFSLDEIDRKVVETKIADFIERILKNLSPEG